MMMVAQTTTEAMTARTKVAVKLSGLVVNPVSLDSPDNLVWVDVAVAVVVARATPSSSLKMVRPFAR
jgi:hypothetical protein